MNKAQRHLEEKHGTPDEFDDACYRAYVEGFCTMGEAEKAMKRYRKEWEEAEKQQD